MSSSSNENEFIQLFTFEWRGNEDNQEGGIANIYSWKHPETTNTQTAFFPCFTSCLIFVQWLFALWVSVSLSVFLKSSESCLLPWLWQCKDNPCSSDKKGALNMWSDSSPLISSLKEKCGKMEKDASMKNWGGKDCQRTRGGGKRKKTYTCTRSPLQRRETTADRHYCMWAPLKDWDASSTPLKAIRILYAISEHSARHRLTRTQNSSSTHQPQILPQILSLSFTLCLLVWVHSLLVSRLHNRTVVYGEREQGQEGQERQLW